MAEEDINKVFKTNLRFLDKGLNENERTNFSNWWGEEINMFGQEVQYYVNSYALSAADNIYGEHPDATFSAPVTVVMLLDLNQNALIFSKFGLQGDDDINAVLHIDTFTKSFSGLAIEPKAGDVFQVEEYGRDRPGERNGKYFEITERLDEEVTQINALMGHYVWLIKAKRHDFSWEPGLSGEKSPSAITDDTFSGRLDGGANPKTPDKPINLGPSADEDAKENFDNDNDDVYGDYGY